MQQLTRKQKRVQRKHRVFVRQFSRMRHNRIKAEASTQDRKRRRVARKQQSVTVVSAILHDSSCKPTKHSRLVDSRGSLLYDAQGNEPVMGKVIVS